MSRHANQMILGLDNPVTHAQNKDLSIIRQSYFIPSDMNELLPFNTDDVTESIHADEYPEEIDFGDEDSDVEKDMEQESDDRN